jgi:hypothetical protein
MPWMPRLALVVSLSAFVIFCLAMAFRDWWKPRDAPASKPAPRSERRAALYSEVQAVAEKLEKFGTSEGDTEVRLLALIVRHGAYQLQTSHGFPENRARRLRDLAEVAAPHVIDKWWRTKEDQAAARAGTLLNEGIQSRSTSRPN